MDDWEIDWLHTCARGPDLSGIFCNEADLTTIASPIWEVLDIDKREDYFTGPAGPIVIVCLEWGRGSPWRRRTSVVSQVIYESHLSMRTTLWTPPFRTRFYTLDTQTSA
jgi:hypothetical protein